MTSEYGFRVGGWFEACKDTKLIITKDTANTDQRKQNAAAPTDDEIDDNA